MSLAILGIDIAKKKFDVALMIGNKTQKYRKFSNNNQGFKTLYSWLVKQLIDDSHQLHICMEATGGYQDQLAEFLFKLGYKVSVVNPARIKGFAQSELARTKTDKADAKLIARFCKAMQPKTWQPIKQEIKELQDMVRRLDALKQMRIQENNRLLICSPVVHSEIKEHIQYLEDKIEKLSTKIKNHIKRYPDLKEKSKLLESIPGIGKETIAVILSEITAIENFSNARKLAAYIGLTPKEHSSGSSVRGRAKMNKTGNSTLRKALYMPAIVAKRFNSVIIEFCNRLEKTGKCNMVIIGAVMRKLVHIIFGVLKSGKAFDPNFAR